MTRAAKQILDDALALPEKDRLDLASELLASVDGPGDRDWDTAWLAELDHRASAADRGEVRAEEWADVRARLLERLAAR
jgi:hypothetical protein